MNKVFKIAFDSIFIVAIILLVLYFLFRLLGVVDIYEVKTVGQALELIKKAVKENE